MQLQALKAEMLKAAQKHNQDIEEEAKKLQLQAEQVGQRAETLARLLYASTYDCLYIEQHKKEMLQHSKALADLASKHENEMRDQMKAHQDSLMQLKTETGKLREALAKAEQRASLAESDLPRLKSEVERTKKELEAAQKAAKEAQADAQRAREQLGALEQNRQQWERERKELEGRVRAAQDAAGKTAALNETLKAEIFDFKTQAERDAQTVKDLQSRLSKIPELENGIFTSRATIKDLEDIAAVVKADKEQLGAAAERLKAEVQKLRAFKTDILSKYAATERNLQDQIFDLIDERNVYKNELEHFYSLPNPCGVGLGLRATNLTDVHASSQFTSIKVTDVVPVCVRGRVCVGTCVHARMHGFIFVFGRRVCMFFSPEAYWRLALIPHEHAREHTGHVRVEFWHDFNRRPSLRSRRDDGRRQDSRRNKNSHCRQARHSNPANLQARRRPV